MNFPKREYTVMVPFSARGAYYLLFSTSREGAYFFFEKQRNALLKELCTHMDAIVEKLTGRHLFLYNAALSM